MESDVSGEELPLPELLLPVELDGTDAGEVLLPIAESADEETSAAAEPYAGFTRG